MLPWPPSGSENFFSFVLCGSPHPRTHFCAVFRHLRNDDHHKTGTIGYFAMLVILLKTTEADANERTLAIMISSISGMVMLRALC